MKTLRILTYTLPMLAMLSCASESNTESQEQDINQIYIEKGQKYFDHKIQEDVDKGITKWKSVIINKVDTVVKLSTKDIENYKLMPIKYKYMQEIELMNDLLEIDSKIGGEYLTITQNQINKAKKLEDQYNEKIKKNESLDSTDHILNMVYFSIDIEAADGSKLKNESLPIIFDLENDIDSGMQSTIMGR